MTSAASVRHLLGRLAIAEARVRAVVAVRRAVDPEPDDPVRGLYVSDEQVDALLAGQEPVEPPDVQGQLAELEQWADEAEAAGADLRLRRLARTFGLDDVDVEVLLVALLPEIDPRFERLYGYLHDDVTRRRASIGLAFELLGLDGASASARGHLGPESSLLATRLVVVGDTNRPFLTRTLEVPDRVAAHLLGDDHPTQAVASLEVEVPVVEVPEADQVARAVASPDGLAYVREAPRTAGLAAGVAGLALAGWPALVIDLNLLAGDPESTALVGDALREAGLRGAGLVAGPVDAAIEGNPRLLDGLRHAPVPVVLVGRRGWDPSWFKRNPATIIAGPLEHEVRSRLWLDMAGDDADFDAAEATLQFRLKPEQTVRAWHAAELQALANGRDVSPEDLRVGVRLQNAGKLDRLARRIEPRAKFEDLVLSPKTIKLLREIVQRARYRGVVLDSWHMGGRSDKGRGITALFAGESGTGKTLSAEVIARELSLDLYVIDLASVVDKYIGETEKNLEKIFVEAEEVNGVLLFDEADALFGKRSEVSDARDRYANIEIAYLLQRMERFDGITILASNMRANLDEAFTRRIDVLIDFPEPEEGDRKALWEIHLPDALPRDGELDISYLAESFELAGGDIRNITLAAAFAVAQDGRAVSTADLVRATAREYRKLGRLVTESEFGAYYDLVSSPLNDQGGS